MKKVVIIGAGEFQTPLIIRARELGCETHVFAWQEGAVGAAYADYFYPVSIRDGRKILEESRRIGPDSVVTIASDLAAVTVGEVAAALGLPANTKDCIEKTTNKYAMRRALREGGIPVPGFAVLGPGDGFAEDVLEHLSWPLIIKPTDRSGSRSITKLEEGASREELREAIRRAMADSFEGRAVVEEYMEGEEYSMEAISYNGHHTFLALTKKYTTGSPHFIETGHLEPAGIAESAREHIVREVFRALDALGVTCGASHAEFMLDRQGRVRIIEIGARMGGDCIGSHLVRLSTGYDYLKMVLDVGMGLAPDFARGEAAECAAVRFLMNREDFLRLEGYKEECIGNIEYISGIQEDFSANVIDSGSRYGYYILTANRREDLIRVLEDGK